MHYTERLKELRTENNISQQRIAEILNTTQQQINKYENGKQELPLRRFIELAVYYNVSLDYLAGMTEDKNGTWNKTTETKK